jgi:rubrerythrin
VRTSQRDLDLLCTAMQIEQGGYDFYAAAAAQAKDSCGVKAFLRLARHKMDRLGKVETVLCTLTKAGGPERARARTSREVSKFPTRGQANASKTAGAGLTALGEAIHAEGAVLSLYLKALDDVGAPSVRAVLKLLIEEGRRHLTMLEAEYNCIASTGFWLDDEQLRVEA